MDVWEAAEEFLEDDFDFESGEAGAEAEVFADAEGEVVVGVAGDVEGIGVCEVVFVAVDGGVPHDDAVAFGNGLAVDLCVGGGDAGHVGDGGGPAEDFFDGAIDEVWVIAEELPLFGVFGEGVHAAGDGVACGFVAGDEEEEAEEEDVHVAELFAFDFGVDEEGDEVFSAVFAAFGDHAHQVGVHLHGGLLGGELLSFA